MITVVILLAGALVSATADGLLGIRFPSFWVAVAHKVVYMTYGYALAVAMLRG